MWCTRQSIRRKHEVTNSDGSDDDDDDDDGDHIPDGYSSSSIGMFLLIYVNITRTLIFLREKTEEICLILYSFSYV